MFCSDLTQCASETILHLAPFRFSSSAASIFLLGFFAGGLGWTLFLCSLASHGRKRAGAGLLRACHVLSALLFAYFSYSVIVHGYRDLILQGAGAM